MRYLLLLSLCFLVACQSKTAPSFSTFSSFDGTQIAFSDEGEGKVVFLIHGFINTRKNWDKSALKDSLLAAGYRVIAPDLRGNGDSEHPREPQAYANDAEVKDLIALADHLTLTQFDVVGYSRGSIVLAKWLTQEKRILKAVIGGMGLDFSDPNWDRRIMFAQAFGGEAELNDITEGAVQYAQSIERDLHILSLQQHHQPVTTVEELRSLQTPILVIAGDQDHDNGEPSELSAELLNGHLKIVPGDHNNAYKSEAFAKEIMYFLKNL
ncbi:MAG: alpha/beta hydrolase [Bacteroidota bacterium]